MQDSRVGAAFRAVRIRRGWRQIDVASRAGVSRSFLSLLERGHFDRVSLATIRSVGAVLDIRIDLVARWRGGELDRLVNAAHSALHEDVIGELTSLAGWVAIPEVSFSVYGERGIIDLLAWHPPSRSLLVIELKTEIVDVNELIGGVDRKRRLAIGLARERGWDPASVSVWVVVASDRTNRRRIAAHRSLLRAAFPDDHRVMHRWLRDPNGAVRGLSTWTNANPSGTSSSRVRRVRVPASKAGVARPGPEVKRESV